MGHTYRPIKKGEKHHWWPESLSSRWVNVEGKINCIRSGGERFPASPRSIARISAGHDLLFGDSEWTRSYEGLFDEPDGSFPEIVDWLEQVIDQHKTGKPHSPEDIYCGHSCTDFEWKRLLLGLVSLGVRSPRHREASISSAIKLRPNIDKAESRNLVTLNLLQGFPQMVSKLADCGKIAIYFSGSCEFVYGDGFYTNLSTNNPNAVFTRMLAPLTPNVAILYTCPMYYKPEPRLLTYKADCGLVRLINDVTQIYSKDFLFYRFQQPELSEHFLAREHLVLEHGDPIESLIASIPGVGFGAPRPGMY